jgi:hypothetical protein
MTPGRLKFISERLKGYSAWLSTGMVLHLWVKSNGLSWWYVVPALVLGAWVVWWVDKKKVYPGESGFALELNPEWQRIAAKVERIERGIDDRVCVFVMKEKPK